MQNTYKPPMATQVTGVVGGLVCFGLTVCSIVHAGTDHQLANIFLSGLFAAIGVVMLRNGTEKITLSDEAVEASNLFRTRRLQRGDIAGWEVCVAGGRGTAATYGLRILPRDKEEGKPVRVSETVRIDGDFKAWLVTLPNLTANKLEEKIKEVKTQADLGDPKAAEQLATLDKFSRMSHMRFLKSPEEMTKSYFARWGL
jgi:hypothetical protein